MPHPSRQLIPYGPPTNIDSYMAEAPSATHGASQIPNVNKPELEKMIALVEFKKEMIHWKDRNNDLGAVEKINYYEKKYNEMKKILAETQVDDMDTMRMFIEEVNGINDEEKLFNIVKDLRRKKGCSVLWFKWQQLL